MPALSVRLHQAGPIPLDVDFECDAGQLLALVGPSGSGKTTVLRIVAGLAACSQGFVAVGGQTWLDTAKGVAVAPQQRRVGLVFQHYALFPHLSATSNVALASGRADAAAHARALLARVGLAALGDRRPAQLSGGQQQRVALARALAREPHVLLLDEPFSAVDQLSRQDLYQQLAELRGELPMPIVLVTHDLHEAQRPADRIAVLQRGRVVASGALDEVLDRPEVARQLPGLEPGSTLHCRVGAHDEHYGLTVLELDGDHALRVPLVRLARGTAVRVRVPAREVALALSQPGDVSIVNRLPGTVTALAPLDATYVDVRLRIGAAIELRARVTGEASERLGLVRGLEVWCLIKSVALDQATLLLAAEPALTPRSSPVPAANDARTPASWPPAR